MSQANARQPQLADDRGWFTRLEDVLNDYEALNRFKNWMGVDDDSSEHPLRLHFAIDAYKDLINRRDRRAFQLARNIYTRFLKQKTGLCAFIDARIREQIGRQLRQIQSAVENNVESAPFNIFDGCLPQLDTFLRRQHALFTASHEFIEFFNSANDPAILPSADQPSSSNLQQPIGQQSKSSRKGKKSSQQQHQLPLGEQIPTAPLTADALFRSQRDREALIGENNSTVQKLFKPVSKFPYVANAHTSKNDSAVSSSFSSDANNSKRLTAGTLNLIRDEQRRSNPSVLAPFPRIEQNTFTQPQCQFRHYSADGRREFAELLSQKLLAVQLRHKQYERMNEQIERITAAAEGTSSRSTARDLIIQSASAGVDEDSAATAALDADDDVENYFRQKILQDSANSQQQSPLNSNSRRTRRKSPRSCSPVERPGGGQLSESINFVPSTNFPFMTQSYVDRAQMPSSFAEPNFCVTEMTRSERRHFNQSCSPDRSFRQRFGNDLSISGHQQFSPQDVLSPKASVSFTQSCIYPPTSNNNSNPQKPTFTMESVDHFVGSPTVTKTSYKSTNSANACSCDNDGETSGIGSMTTTHFSDASNPSMANFAKRKAAAFRKANELSSQPAISSSCFQHHLVSTSIFGTASRVKKSNENPHPNNFASLPKATIPANHYAGVPKMTIGYRDLSSGDGVPVVANVPMRPITFKEFRRYFSISSKDQRQFFFKSICEDSSAPYQLLLVDDDSTVLPIFAGRVTAECRRNISDSD